jgi:hypothetical protein
VGQRLPPPRLSLEIREPGGLLLGAAVHDLGAEDLRSGGVRFELERLPFADGRFYVTLSLSGSDGGVLYHKLERAAEFLVYPKGEGGGLVYFDGRWAGLRSTTRS